MQRSTDLVIAFMTVTFTLSIVLTGQGADQGNAEAIKRDLAKLQGTWELIRRVENGTVRSVKVIEGNKTALSRFDPNGVIYWAHTSEFTIAITGSVRVFTFFNMKVTAGPHKGSKSEEKNSHIYRVDDDTLVEAHGLLIDEEDEEPRIVVWKRVKETRAFH